MASPAETVAKVQTLVAATAGAAPTPAQMVAILDVAIAAAMMHDGQLVVSYSLGGRSQTIGIRDARELREYYRGVAADDASNGGFVPQYVEFH